MDTRDLMEGAGAEHEQVKEGKLCGYEFIT